MRGFGNFASKVRARLRKGAAVYGDRSFSADPADLLREIQEELEDVAGWGFILWTRLERARKALEKIGEDENGKRKTG